MKRISQVLVSALILSLFLMSVSLAEVFNVTHLPFGDKASTVAKDKSSGVQLWKNNIEYQKVSYKGRTVLYSVENGRGIYGSDKTEKAWVARSYSILDGNRLIPYEVNIVYSDNKGTVIKKIAKYFERGKKTVTTVVNGAVKTFNYDNDLIDKEILSSCLSNYPFGKKNSMQFHLLTLEPAVYKMTVYDRGRETVNGVVCQKLELVPDLGAINVFGAFIPKMYFWFNAKAPNDFVKYEGLESGLGTPYITIERTN